VQLKPSAATMASGLAGAEDSGHRTEPATALKSHRGIPNPKAQTRTKILKDDKESIKADSNEKGTPVELQPVVDEVLE